MFKDQGSMFRVQGGNQRSGIKVRKSMFKAQCPMFNVQCSRSKVQGLMPKVQGSRCKFQGSRFKVQGSRCRAQGPMSKVQCSRFIFFFLLFGCWLGVFSDPHDWLGVVGSWGWRLCVVFVSCFDGSLGSCSCYCFRIFVVIVTDCAVFGLLLVSCGLLRVP